jgi:GGDEF domain-containing protein
MGRGTSYLTDATKVVYIDVSEYDEDGHAWGDLIDDIQEILRARFTSLDYCDDWDGREVNIILENTLVQIGVSEYCGMATLSCRVHEGLADRLTGIADRYIKMIEEEIDRFGEYSKIGTFSNGQSVFEKINKGA